VGLKNVVAATQSGLGITDKERLQWIDEHARDVAAANKAEKEALQLFQVAFGLAAMALSGGTAGFLFAGLAAGVGPTTPKRPPTSSPPPKPRRTRTSTRIRVWYPATSSAARPTWSSPG
jgi:hypothetical protein